MLLLQILGGDCAGWVNHGRLSRRSQRRVRTIHAVRGDSEHVKLLSFQSRQLCLQVGKRALRRRRCSASWGTVKRYGGPKLPSSRIRGQGTRARSHTLGICYWTSRAAVHGLSFSQRRAVEVEVRVRHTLPAGAAAPAPPPRARAVSWHYVPYRTGRTGRGRQPPAWRRSRA